MRSLKELVDGGYVTKEESIGKPSVYRTKKSAVSVKPSHSERIEAVA